MSLATSGGVWLLTFMVLTPPLIDMRYAAHAAFDAERGMRYTILQPRSHAP